jgi:hypothetical protein
MAKHGTKWTQMALLSRRRLKRRSQQLPLVLNDLEGFYLAPQVGLEPTTLRLTELEKAFAADCYWLL